MPSLLGLVRSAILTGQLASIDMVYDELAKYGDELSDWVKARKNQFLLVSDAATQNKYTEVITHINNLPNKSQSSVAKFFDGADPWLIAKAVCINATVVTHESLVANNSTKIKIPNICNDFNVQYINSFELLRILRAKFVLA